MRVKNEPLSKRTRGAKCMVMATGKRAVDEVLSAKSDPTVRSFASEDAAASHHAQQAQRSEELSEWGVGQDATHRFCRFEACTWQSFGTRPSSTTPHGFEARSLMLKLAQDPAIVHIMREREYRVGLLAELDPIDDRLSEKLEDGGKRLLGYNTNAGASIHIRLRTHDLSGFLAYPALIDTLLHELAHNEVGPHNEQFWHLFCQLKADYLRALSRFASRGDLFNGKSALHLAHAADEVRDVRGSVLAALERDRQQPAGPLQTQMLAGYLAAASTVSRLAADGRASASDGKRLGGAQPDAAAAHTSAPLTVAEKRSQALAAVERRMGGNGAPTSAQAAGPGDSAHQKVDEAAPPSSDATPRDAMDVSDAAES
jgi:hypothetical protein